MEFTVGEVTVFRIATFLNEALRQIYFLRNLHKSGLKNVISIRNNKFDHSNCYIDNYCFLSSY